MSSVASDLSLPEDQESPLMSYFSKRKAAFLDSLRHILASVTSDKFVQQMFEDPSSAMFIPDRVIELVQRYLTDDREIYLQDLYRRISAIEAYFGQEEATHIVDIGRKIIDYVIKNEPNIDKEYIETLKHQLDPKIPGAKRDLRALKRALHAIAEDLEASKRVVQRMLKLARNGTSITREKAQKVVANLLGQIRESAEREKQLKQQLDSAQKRFNKVDIPRIQQHFEEQIAEHAANEEALSKELNKSKKTILQISKEHQRVLNELSETKAKAADYPRIEAALEESLASNREHELQLQRLKRELKENKQKLAEAMNESNTRSAAMDSEFQETVLAAKGKLKEKNAVIAELRKQVESERQKKEEAIDAKTLIEVDLEMAQNKLESFVSMKKEKEELAETCASLRAANEKMSKRIEKMKQNGENTQRDIQKLREELEESANENKKQIEIIKDMSDLRNQISYLKGELSNRDAIIEQSQRKYDDLERELTQQREFANDYKKRLGEEKSKRDDNAQSYEARIVALNDKCEQYASNVQIYKQKLSQSNRRANDLAAQCEKSEEENGELQKKLSSALQELNDTRLSLGQLNEALLYSQDDLKKKDAIIEQFSKNEKTIIAQKEELGRELEKAEAAIAQRRNVIRDSEMKMKTLQQDIVDKEVEIKQLKANVQALGEKRQKYKTKKQKFANIIENLQKQAKSHEMTADTVTEANETLRMKISGLKNDIKLEREAREIAESGRSKALDDLKHLQLQIQEDRRRYKEDLAGIQEQLSKTQEEKSDSDHRAERSEYENRNLKQKFEQREQDLQFANERLQQDVNSLEAKSKKQEEDWRTVNDELGSVNSRIQKLMLSIPRVEKLEDIPDILDKYRVSSEEHERELEKLKRILETDDLLSAAEKMKRENRDLQKREKQLCACLSDTAPEELADRFASMKREFDRMQKQEQEMMNITSIEKSGNLVDELARMKREKQLTDQREEEISSLLPSYSFESLPRAIAMLQNDLKKLQDRESSILETVGGKGQNLPRAISEMNSRLEEDDAIIRGIIQAIPGSDKEGIVHVVGQLQREKAALDEEKRKILAVKGGSLTSAVDSLLSDSQDLRSITRLLSPGSENPTTAVENLLREQRKLANEQKDLQRLLECENVADAVSALVKSSQALEKTLSGGEGSIESRVSELLRSKDDLEKEKRKIDMLIPSEFGQGDARTRLGRIVEQHRALKSEQDRISSLLGDSGGNNYEKVGDLIREKNVLAKQQSEIERLIPDDFIGLDLVERVRGWSRDWSDLSDDISSCGVTGSTLPQKVTNVVSERKKLLDERDRIADMLKSPNVFDKIEFLLAADRDLEEVEQAMNAKIRGSAGKQVASLVGRSDLLSNVEKVLGCAPTDIETRVSTLKQQVNDVYTSLKLNPGSDIGKKLSELQHGLDAAKRHIKNILTTLIKTNLEFDIPMEDQQEKRLLEVLDDFRKRAENAFVSVENVLNRGRSVGYKGDEILESVDYIAQVAVDEEKQIGMERMHQELTTLSTMLERARTEMERRKEQSNKKIEELRNTVAQAQERAAQKEEEFLSKLEKQQEASRFSQHELEREKKIHEELMRVIGGKATDTEFLKCYLPESEFLLIHRAEDILRAQK